MNNSNEVTVVIADDHPLVRFGLKAYLAGEPRYKVVGEASNGLEALNKILALQPQLAILDIVMPKMDGFEVVRKLHSFPFKPKILLLTAVEEFVDPSEVLNSGADGAVLKDIKPREFLSVIDSIMERGKVYSKAFFQLACNRYNGTLKSYTKETLSISDLQQKIISMRLNGYHFAEISDILKVDFSVIASEITKFLECVDEFDFLIRGSYRTGIIFD